ncbi:MAG: hypothetical protein RML46_07765 [Anaerolineae bacterium]|nr:hypothetical protein [Anaerolineae bacterium]MDW8068793.1 hypothetical protein [Anaerolineae bacterium]
MKFGLRPPAVIVVAFGASFLLYLFGLVLPYSLFAHVAQTPVSFPEIARREPLPAVLFLATFLALFGLYSWVYRTCCRHPRQVSPALLLFCGLVLAVLLIFAYPVGAGDVVDYVTHGEELFYYRENPLVVPPGHLPDAVFARYSVYRMVPSNYGPLWTWVSALVVGAVGRESLALNLLGFKAVAVAAYLAQAGLVYAILRRRNPDLASAGLAFFAWNPLVLYEFAANGHNDAAMMAFALLGIYFWERRCPWLMTTALTFSFLIKIPTAPLLPLFLLASWRDQPLVAQDLSCDGLVRHPLRPPGSVPDGKSTPYEQRSAAERRPRGFASVRRVLLLVGLSGMLVALAYLSLPDPLAALTNLSTRSGLLTHSLPAVLSRSLRLAGMTEKAAGMVAQLAALGAFAIAFFLQLVRTWRRPGAVLRHAFDLMLFLLLFTTPWFQPWYVTWAVALAALLPRPEAPLQAGLFSLTVVFSYVVYGFVWFWIPHQANWGNTLGITLIAVATTYAIPWGYTLRVWWRTGPSRG